MSRKISHPGKKKWLAMFETRKHDGKTRIALHVGKGLAYRPLTDCRKASRQRSLANAESEMLRTALQTHQGKTYGKK